MGRLEQQSRGPDNPHLGLMDEIENSQGDGIPNPIPRIREKLTSFTLMQTDKARGGHESGWVGFESNPESTRPFTVLDFWTQN